MDYNTDLLVDGCSEFGVMLTNTQIDQFIKYFEILVDWNKVMNLTGITEFNEVLVKHFVDSLAVAKILDMENVNSVIDVGTGAGFPGIPLKITFPHMKITLLDSLKKRIGFLDEVIGQLGLKDIETIHGRAEEYAKQKSYRETYDLCVSRAVANLATLTEYCIPYVKVEGKFIPYKSGKIDEELANSEKAVKILGGNISDIKKFCLPSSDIERSFIIIDKIKKTPGKYPRKAGLPNREPLT